MSHTGKRFKNTTKLRFLKDPHWFGIHEVFKNTAVKPIIPLDRLRRRVNSNARPYCAINSTNRRNA